MIISEFTFAELVVNSGAEPPDNKIAMVRVLAFLFLPKFPVPF
jgi:hypothetical protein